LRLYLEPSVLVKLFKKEPNTEKMIDVVGAIDERRDWHGCTSRWTFLEVARALKKDGKPKELIELDLKELRRHRISFIDVTKTILSDAEQMLASYSLYASDAVHVSTFRLAGRRRRLDAMLTDDRHLKRFERILTALTLDQISP